jgi:hypothetical protein
LIAALAANTARLCDGLRVELARSVKLEEGHPLQFEADPWSWGISSCASEEPVITDDWLSHTLTWGWFERANEAGVNRDAMISDELCPWFANCWEEVGVDNSTYSDFSSSSAGVMTPAKSGYSAQVWDVATGKRVCVLQRHTGAVLHLAFHVNVSQETGG